MTILSFVQRRMDHWIALRNPETSGQIKLQNRRLYILPTRFGYIYALMQIVLLLAAINYQNSMTYVLTFLLTSLGIISLWQTHKNLLGLSIELKTPSPVYQGEELIFEFVAHNLNQSNRYAVGLQYTNAPPVYSSLSGEQTTTIKLPLPTIKRGLYKPAGIIIFTRYPTGLFHAWGWLKYDVPVLIYPKPIYDSPLKDLLINQQSGNKNINTADGDDFAGLRGHKKGESLRHISWKAYAQGRGMLTKTFQGYASPSLWIDWFQMTATSHEGKLSQMIALVIQAHQEGRKYGVKLPGIDLPQSSGPAHKADCLQQISVFNQSDLNSTFLINGIEE